MHYPSKRGRSAICSRRLVKYPTVKDSSGPRLNDPFVSVVRASGSVERLSGKPESQMVIIAPADVRRERNSLAGPARQTAVRKSRFLMAAANSTFGNKKYVVEVGTSKQPIKAVFREATKTMLIGLVFGLALATLGSVFFVKCALVPVRKIALAVQALPVIHSEEEGIKAGRCPPTNRKSMRYLQRNARSIGGLLPNWDEASGRGCSRAGRSAGKSCAAELADLFAKERLPIGVTQTLLSLLKETERVSDISQNLATSSREDTGEARQHG